MPYILNAALTGLFLVLCITASVSAQPISLPLDVKRHELRNGLQILTLENHTLPIISYYTFFRVGSRHESIGQAAISHLFEHMMFTGGPCGIVPKSSTRYWSRAVGLPMRIQRKISRVIQDHIPGEIWLAVVLGKADGIIPRIEHLGPIERHDFSTLDRKASP